MSGLLPSTFVETPILRTRRMVTIFSTSMLPHDNVLRADPLQFLLDASSGGR